MWKNVMQGKVLFQVIDPMFDTGDIKFSYLKINDGGLREMATRRPSCWRVKANIPEEDP